LRRTALVHRSFPFALSTTRSMTDTHITVCTTCRATGTSREQRADGLNLFDAVQEALWAAETADGVALNVQLRGQACMSGCNRACTLAVQSAGKWTYYWGDLAPDAETAEQVVACARMHQFSTDGELEWKARPERLKSGVLARIPATAAAAQRV
jgi:predicted metal-binding protein